MPATVPRALPPSLTASFSARLAWSDASSATKNRLGNHAVASTTPGSEALDEAVEISDIVASLNEQEIDDQDDHHQVREHADANQRGEKWPLLRHRRLCALGGHFLSSSTRSRPEDRRILAETVKSPPANSAMTITGR